MPDGNPDQLTQEQWEQQPAMEKLVTIMAMLRNPEFGCPWDLEQTIRSLMPFTLEEAYEVADAIEQEDMVELQEELGDLLFQVVFYARIAEEEGQFEFDDIAAAITRKLIRRHPHVFPEGRVENFGRSQDISSDQVVVNWEQIKAEERREKAVKRRQAGMAEKDRSEGVLGDVPRALPALERARKLQKRAAQHGFDWPSLEPVLAKLKEEVSELEDSLGGDDRDAIEHELGDVLFAVVNMARHLDVETEVVLRKANARFESRFRWIESALAGRGRQVRDADLEELDALWDEAKAAGL